MLGVQTPLQSGRMASADQSFACGGGLMRVPAMAAGTCTASPTSAAAATLHLRAVNDIANSPWLLTAHGTVADRSSWPIDGKSDPPAACRDGDPERERHPAHESSPQGRQRCRVPGSGAAPHHQMISQLVQAREGDERDLRLEEG